MNDSGLVDHARVRQHQRIRLQRLSLAGASYILQAAIALAVAWLGAVDWGTVAVYVFGLALIIVSFQIIFRSDFNLRFARPNLTFSQVLCPLLPALYLLMHIDSLPARTGVLLTVMVPLLYGILDLSVRHFLAASLAYFLCYLSVFAINVWPYPFAFEARSEWLVLITLALLLLQISLIGGFISSLRRTLRRTNRELNDAMHKISDMAVRDELTGIFNRRRLMDVLKVEAARTARSGTLFSVCLFDLDFFKQVNDQRGHMVGDRVLVAIADAIDNVVRDIDTFGRFGGEEFLLIMPLTDLTAAARVAERIRRQVSEMELVDDAGVTFRVTVSIGVATCLPETITDTNALLRRADRALYLGKSGGRNRVVFADDDD